MRRATMLKIATLMRENLDHGITILGISKKLKIGYRPAYTHVNSMEKEGIIRTERVGNAKQSFLNLTNAKCRHLLEEVDILRKEALLNGHVKLRNVLENLVSRLGETFISDIHSIVLFGSYAKGTPTKLSDIDLLFITVDVKNKELRAAIERESASYQYSYNVKINPIIADIVEFKKMLKSKDLNVGKEARSYGIAIYGSEMFWRLVV